MRDKDEKIRYKLEYWPYLIIVFLINIALIIPALMLKRIEFAFISIGLFVLIALIMLIINKIINKKTISDVFYEKKVPSDLNPVFVRLLFNDIKVDKTCLATTIADLFKRKYLKIISEDGMARLVQTNKKEKDLMKFEKIVLKAIPKKNEETKKIYFKEYREAVMDEYPKCFMIRKKEKENYKLEFSVGLIFSIIVIPTISYGINHIGNDSISFWFLIAWTIWIFIFNLISMYTWFFDSGKGVKDVAEVKAWNDFIDSLYMYSRKKDRDLDLWNYYYTYTVMADLNPTEKENMLLLVWPYFK